MKGNRGGTGRPPKATALHILNGTFRKKRHGKGRAGEPDIGDGRLPPPPDDLSDEVRAAWMKLAETLEHRIFSKADVRSFHAFASMWAQWESAQKHIEKHGIIETVVTKDGRKVRGLSGEAKMWSDLSGKLLSYFSRYGMTPADRSRVRETPKGGKDGHEENPDDEFGTRSA